MLVCRVLAVVIFAFAAGVNAAATSRYAFYPNFPGDNGYPDPGWVNTSKFGIMPGNLTKTGGPPGLWPVLHKLSNGTYVPVNGGVPQAANLTAHLDRMKASLVAWLPDPNYSGNAVFDFENWTPIWEQNDGAGNWHGKRYQLYSMSLVEKQHPSWNRTAVAQEAKRRFEAAALDWFVQSLETVKSLRPKARWGFYGFPQGVFGACVNWTSPTPQCSMANPVDGPVARANNDQLAAVWAASTAIYPSIYLPGGSWTSPSEWAVYLKQYVIESVKESVRLSQTYGKPTRDGPHPLVLPYMWMRYEVAEIYQNPNFISIEDMHMYVEEAYQPPLAVGAVVWGGYLDYKFGNAQYFNTTGGPIMQWATRRAEACAQDVCHGHGACSALPPRPVEYCVCDAGWGGAACDVKA